MAESNLCPTHVSCSVRRESARAMVIVSLIFFNSSSQEDAVTVTVSSESPPVFSTPSLRFSSARFCSALRSAFFLSSAFCSAFFSIRFFWLANDLSTTAKNDATPFSLKLMPMVFTLSAF